MRTLYVRSAPQLLDFLKTAEDDELMLPGEVAALLRVDPKTVTRWTKTKPPRLPARRTPGGHTRIRVGDVRPLLRGRQRTTGARGTLPQ